MPPRTTTSTAEASVMRLTVRVMIQVTATWITMAAMMTSTAVWKSLSQ